MIWLMLPSGSRISSMVYEVARVSMGWISTTYTDAAQQISLTAGPDLDYLD